MILPIEKIVATLGERFARDAERLRARRTTAVPWLALIEPLIERSIERVQGAGRFERHDAVSQSPADALGPAAEEPAPAWPPNGTSLPAAARDRLRDIVGPAADLARVHVDERADALARRERADAVTVGDQIYFRSGTFAPHEPAGFALLAHEMTHVAESLRPGASWRRATPAGVQAEERLAGRRERAAMQPARSPMVPVRAPVAAAAPAPPVAVPAVAPAAHMRPMKAEMDRAPIDVPSAPSDAGPNLETMRRTLFRDLMNQIRVEFERGA